MSGLIGGIVAFMVGTGLATATVVGLVQSRSASAEAPIDGSLQSQVIDYGTNQG